MHRFVRRYAEWIPVKVWALLVAGLLLLPYRQRYADEWHGWRFTGIASQHFGDTASHLSWVRQARDGWWLFESKFAGAEPRGHRFFNLLFLAMGKAARWTGLSVPGIFHVERTLAAVAVLMLAYWFAGQFFTDRRMRWVALILTTTSAAPSWLGEYLRYGLLRPGEHKLVESITLR